MAFLDTAFDLADIPQSDNSYDLLPAGWYNATMTKAEVKKTKAETGKYIAIRYDITGPTHQGRVVFGNLNIKNPNAKAEEIGRQQLGEIMRAIGLNRVTDTDQLIGGQLQIKVAVKEASGGYEAGNEIKGFKALTGSPAPMPTAAPAPQATAGSAPPWATKK